MGSASIWKEKDETLSMSPAEYLEWSGRNRFNYSRKCRHYDSGRCYSPFADSRACRCRGSIGCVNFKM